VPLFLNRRWRKEAFLQSIYYSEYNKEKEEQRNEPINIVIKTNYTRIQETNVEITGTFHPIYPELAII
jgi:hypothetical protein